LNTHLGSVVIPGDFATMLILHWQPKHQQIHYANAGHEPGLLIRSSGERVLLESDGFMVGAVPEATWSLHSVPVGCGDRLFMYTDGAVEIFNSQRELFGRKRLHETVASTCEVPLRNAIADVTRQLDDFRGNRPFADDVTLLIMEFNATVDEAIAQIP
jgi:sigma-B regulation protein RsbU (phosphoserine phosphatase)